MLDEGNRQENRRVAELILEIQSLALKTADNPPSEANFWILEEEPELNFFMDRPLHSLQESPSPSFSIDSDTPLEIDLEQGLSEIYRQVYVDETLLRNNIDRALTTRNEITLAELVELYPIAQGLAEIVAYVGIAKQEESYYINKTKFEYININSVESEDQLSLTMEQVVFRRAL